MPDRIESVGMDSESAVDSHMHPSERTQMLDNILYLKRLEDEAPNEVRRERLQKLMRAYESAFGPQKWE